MKSVLTTLLALLVTSVCVHAQDDTYLTIDDAGSDYQIQGEYTGTVGSDGEKTQLGVQVIALGEGKFDAVVYMGGLPGAGWDGSDKIRGQGQAEGDVAKFRSEGQASAEISGGRMVIRSESGETLGTLNRTIRKSPTLGAEPPAGATVLFDGKSADHFERGTLTMGDLLAADCETKHKFGSHKLHIEFRTPFKPKARGQARGNSGVYIQGRYECQVLDSFGLEGENNECGGIYSIARPAVNACLPPLTWQTYDIDFTAAEYEGDRKVKNSRVTIRHNGIVIHDDLELTHGTPGKHPEGPGPDVIYLQGHGNPVVYRNIWVVEKK